MSNPASIVSTINRSMAPKFSQISCLNVDAMLSPQSKQSAAD
jgi:hypothetical protein